MADGTLIFDTKLDLEEFKQSYSKLQKEVSDDLVIQTTVDSSGLKKDTSKLGSTALKASDDIQKLSSSTGAFGDVMKGVLGANLVQQAGEKLLDFAKDAITAASDLQEVQNVVDVTFGKSADIINDFAKDGAKAFGLTELQTKRYAGTLGSLFKSMGLGQDEVTEFSVSMSGLVGDMASFYNLDYETAFEKLRSGISGETEPLKQLGVNMSVANLEAFALAQGIKTSYENMSEAQKATLRYQYILEATADAQGDFNRTQDSFANQMRTLENNFSTLSANVGETLLPVLSSVLSTINSIFNWSFGGQKTELQKSIEAAAESLQDVQTEIDTIKNDYASTVIQIKIDYQKAEGLLEDYEYLKGIENRSAEQTESMRQIVSELTTMYPELSKYVGKDGLFKAESTQVQALIDDYTELARVKAYQQMVSEIYGQYLKAEFEYAQLGEKKGVAEGRVAELEDQYDAISGLINRINNMPMLAQWEMDLYGGFMDANRVKEAADALREYMDLFGGFDSSTLEALTGAGIDISSFTDITGELKEFSELDTEGIANIFRTLSMLTEPGFLGESLSQTSDDLTSAQESLTTAENELADGFGVVTDAYGELETAVSSYEKLTGESGQQFLDGLSSSLENGSDTITTSLGEVNTKMVKTVADTSKIPSLIDIFGSSVSSHLLALDLPELEVAIRAKYYGFGDTPTVGPVAKSHATGIDRVPYDNYLANLHRGEAVLRADDAARWRSGQSGSGDNAAALAAVAQSMEAVAARPVKVYVGKKEIISAVADGMYTEMNNISRTHARGVGK